jgi:hypothetical protein
MVTLQPIMSQISSRETLYPEAFIPSRNGEDSSTKKVKNMVHWEHRYLLGTMVFTIAGDVVRDFEEEYEAWSWLEQDGWGLVAIEPPDPVRPGACKYYFKRQRLPEYSSLTATTDTHATVKHERREKR